MKPHQEMHDDGTTMGRDPRTMNVADLEGCGLIQASRGDAIRAKCIDCMAGNVAEVRRCGDTTCALWPFRMGSDPWHTRVMSEEQRTAARDRLAGARAARQNVPS